MVVLSFKDHIDSSNINFQKPVKSEGKWNINISPPFMFKTPRVKLNKERATLMFNLKNKALFVKFLEDFEDVIINRLHESSSELFNGRKFSLEKIKNSLKRSWDITEDGNVILNTSCRENLSKVVCTDMFGEKTDFENVDNSVSAVLTVKNISFTKNLFEIDFEISHLKMSRFEVRQIDNPFDQEIVPVSVPVVESTNPTIEDCADSMDFFLE